MGDNSRSAMYASGRASSVSPTAINNESVRGAKPPPPVRPKPKRTITAPILTVRPEISITDETKLDEKTGSDLSQGIKKSEAKTAASDTITTPLPVKGTVKALAERFNAPKPQSSSNSNSMVKSTAELFENKPVVKDTKRQRPAAISGGNSGTLLRFPKPAPPGRRQTTSLSDAIGGNATEKQGDENAAFSRELSGSAVKPVNEKRGSLERRRRQKDEQRRNAVNGVVSTVSSRASAQKTDERSRAKAKQLKRSRSCDVVFGRTFAESARLKSSKTTWRNRRRWNSADYSGISTIAVVKAENLAMKATKKAPPAVPPKPAKKPSLVPSPGHEYAEYDVLPSTSPSSIFTASSSILQKQQESKRISLPPDRLLRQLPEAPSPSSVVPTQLYDSPGRLSLGTASPNTPNLATMELLNDSQLNISGHIYCAVRHGEVIEDDDDAVNRIPTSGNRKDSDSDDEPSFSAAVFGAIELATGRRIATDEHGNRLVDEDAITNYEEIMEDLVPSVSHFL